MNKLEWRVEQSLSSFSDCLYVFDRGSHSVGRAIANEMVILEKHEPNTVAPPLLRVEYGELQGLMDAMWNAGIRPNNGEGSTGQLGATERHLADMQTIVMHKLGIKK